MESKIIGYTTGVFDLFHIGHLNILARAKEQCDFLIVGVTTDEVTKQMKGKSSIIPFEERIEIVNSIKHVDMVVAKSTIDNTESWHELRFNVYFKGDDWKGTKKGEKLEVDFGNFGVEIKYFPYTKGTSSTKLREVLEKTI